MITKHIRNIAWLAFASLALAGCPQKEEAARKKEAATAAAPAPAPAVPTPDKLLPGAWEADVRANLIKLIDGHGKGAPGYDAAKPPVVVFDFDNTSIHGDIGRAFFDYMVSQLKIKFTGEIWKALPDDRREKIRAAYKAVMRLPAEKQASSPELQEYRKRMHNAYWSLCRQLDSAKCYPWQVRFYAGYDPDQIRRMAGDVMSKELARPLGSEQIRTDPDDKTPTITSTGIRIHEEIRSLMNLLRKRGFSVWVVSAGPQWVVAGAANRFGMNRDQVIGMRTKLVDGKLTTEMEPPPTFKTGKVDAIKKFIGRKPVLVIGDSWSDAEMMGYAEQAILIDRGYADLKKKALQSGWWIQPTFPVK